MRFLRTAEKENTVWMERIDHWQIEGKWIQVPVAAIFDLKGTKVVHWSEYLDFSYMNQFNSRPNKLLKKLR